MYVTRRKKGDKISFNVDDVCVTIYIGKFHKSSVDLIFSANTKVKIERSVDEPIHTK